MDSQVLEQTQRQTIQIQTHTEVTQQQSQPMQLPQQPQLQQQEVLDTSPQKQSKYSNADTKNNDQSPKGLSSSASLTGSGDKKVPVKSKGHVLLGRHSKVVDEGKAKAAVPFQTNADKKIKHKIDSKSIITDNNNTSINLKPNMASFNNISNINLKNNNINGVINNDNLNYIGNNTNDSTYKHAMNSNTNSNVVNNDNIINPHINLPNLHSNDNNNYANRNMNNHMNKNQQRFSQPPRRQFEQSPGQFGRRPTVSSPTHSPSYMSSPSQNNQQNSLNHPKFIEPPVMNRNQFPPPSHQHGSGLNQQKQFNNVEHRVFCLKMH